MTQEARSGSIPRYNLGSYTLIHDKDDGCAVMHLNGVIVLPVGTHIELKKPDEYAYVVGVRLLAPDAEDNAVYVCLDVSKNKPA